MKKIKILDLFAGSNSLKRTLNKEKFEIFSIDVKDFGNMNMICDIEFLDPSTLNFVPDIVWASPPCTSFSIAAVSHHRKDGKPISDFAKKSDNLILNTLKIIKYFDCEYYIENPRGMLRKMDYMQGIPKTTITYCQYGESRMKPTDVFSNNIFEFGGEWKPRSMCKNGMPCHESAPRGSKTGTQGLKNNFERSKVPHQLINEIFNK